MDALHITLLGSPRAERAGRLVVFDTRKATALLAYLAVTGRPQGRDSLADLLWPDYDPAQARGGLRRTLSVLKSATGGDVVVADRSTVTLAGGRGADVDVTDFRRLAAPRHCPPATPACPQCLADLTSAADLYGGDFLAGFTLRDSPAFDDWQASEAGLLRQQLAGVLERVARARARADNVDAALDAARRWLALDPLHEPAHVLLMRLYASTGQRSAAIRQYRDCVRILDAELGVSPLSATTQLDAAIRSGRLPPPRPATQRPAPGVVADAPPPRAALPEPLVGRARELALLKASRAAVGPGGRLVVLAGEAGIGKSRLLRELTGGDAAGPVVVTRCHEGEAGLAFGVVSDVLRSVLRTSPTAFADLPPGWRAEVGRLLPELADARAPAPPALDSPGARTRFTAALVGAVTAALGPREGPRSAAAVLAVEDVHWADDSSAEVLSYLVRRLADLPLLVVLTWRTESVRRSGALQGATTTAAREGVATVVDLERLDLDAVAELATAWLPAPLTTSAALRLWQETGGLPLFVTEYLAAFSRDGQVPDGGQWQLPGGMRDLLQSRLDGLGETTRQVLAAGAVLGRDLSPDLLRATSGRGEAEVVDALDEAVDRAVVVQTERGTHEFGHESMRQLIYDTSSLARKRLLHSRAADALAGRRVPPAAPDVVAAHLRLAGRADESAVWSWQAAERARGLYAHGEALEHLAAAAAHGHPGQEVHQATGDVLTALGRYREAIDAYERAAATTPADDALALATLEHRLAEVHHRLGAWDVAASHLAAALGQLSGEGGEALRARVLADTALVAHRRGHAGEAAAAAESSLVIAAEAGDHAALAQAHDVLGVLAAESHDVALAERHLQVSLEHASVLADPGYRVAALNNLALVRADNGEADAAVAVAREALQLGLEHGDRHRAAALHTNLADLLHASGHQQEAREHLTSAARLYATLDDDDLRRPEIWKLARW